MKTTLNKHFGFLLLAILFLLTAIVFEATKVFTTSNGDKLAVFQKALYQKEAKLDFALTALSQELKTKEYHTVLNQNKIAFEDLYFNEGIVLLGFENDSLAFWSHNAAPVNNYLNIVQNQDRIIKLQNGWYEIVALKEGDRTLAGLLLIKKEFPHQNKFLVNGFQKGFNLDPGVSINFHAAASSEKVYSQKGDFLFTLIFPANPVLNNIEIFLPGFLYLMGFVFLLVFLEREINKLFKPIGRSASFLLFFGIIIALRVIALQLKLPSVFYNLPLFSPSHYATSFLFPSMGDLLLNSVLVFYLSFFVHRNLKWDFSIARTPKKNMVLRLVLSFVMLSLVFVFSWQITDWIKGLIENSRLSFNVNNIFSLNVYSYTGLGIVGILLLAFFIVSDKVLTTIFSFDFRKKQLVPLFLLSSVVWVGSCYLAGTHDWVTILWPFPVISTIWWIKSRSDSSYSFTGILIIVLLFSGFASHIFSKYTTAKEKKSRTVLIQKLAQEKDPIAEFLFTDIEKKIAADEKTTHYFSNYWQNKKEADNYIKEKYFDGFWGKYDLQFTACKAFDSLLVSPDNQQVECISFFENIISQYGQKVNNSNLFFLNNNSGRISYIARLLIPAVKGGGASVFFIEFDSKFIPEGTGYPELLLDLSEIKDNPDKLNYSYAKYKNGQLLSKSGTFNYNLTPAIFDQLSEEFVFINREDYNHLVYKIDEDTLVVLSKIRDTKFNKLTTFSYLFAFFSLFLLILLFIRQIPKGFYLFWNDFKSRIQALLIGTIIISILLFGAGTIYYIQKQYRQKNENLINEKIKSVLIELEHKLVAEPVLKKEMEDYISFLLIKFSNVFFTDINLYHLDGSLLASSRKEIFDIGLVDRQMNAEAFAQLAINEKTEFIHDEKIGNLKYLSVYVPFRNEEGKQLAYLNLPYFSKQNELEKEISFFLEALINIYVLLFVLSVLVAIFISNYITHPLRLIRSKLRNVKLGTSNELIEWKGKDEIGSLVNEYNRMILELTESAEMLAKSERESAWREMAKQVAHEIKNPLTPIKLSVQHLEHTWNDKDPDFDKKLKRFTLTLIEQIETLTNIANEFSNFAQMPRANNEKQALSAILESTIHLFKDIENISVSYHPLSDNNDAGYYIYADKEQLLRVFNNLVKNAIQSIPKERKGLISLSVSSKDGQVIVAISDNGTGINEDQKEKIFVPNFTTKTAGMGLGLAMVKNIVQSAGGKIWFTTEQDLGTVFYVSLPLYFEGEESSK